jgi:hypothetical protein
MPDGVALLLGELMLNEVELRSRDVNEKLFQSASRNLVVVNVKTRHLASLQRGQQSSGSLVIDLIVLELKVIEHSSLIN